MFRYTERSILHNSAITQHHERIEIIDEYRCTYRMRVAVCGLVRDVRDALPQRPGWGAGWGKDRRPIR